MRLRPKFESEKALAKVAVAWLAENGWEVFQEVSTGQGSPICDLVAKRGPVTWAIECKLSLNLDVIAQALHWRFRANYCAVCVPSGRASIAAESLLQQLGVGWLFAYPEEDSRHGPRLQFQAGPFRRARSDIRRFLREEQKTFCEAGGNRGGHFSPFKATCREVAGAVANRPGLTMKELLSTISHHYGSDATARACIAKWAEAGSISGVKVQRVGKHLTLHPV